MSEPTRISRRAFARTALAAGAVAVLPGELLAQSDKVAAPVKPPEPPAQQSPAAEPELSSTAKAEVEQNYRALLQKYGSRLNDEQKKDVERLLTQQQKSIEALRAFPLHNGDEPGTVLRFLPAEVK